jgi:hypothetical protein
MHFTFEVGAAETLARSLEEFFASNGLLVSKELSRSAIAVLQGYGSWTALVDATSPEALDPQLNRWERAHIRGSVGDKYGEEVEMRVHTGYALRYEASSGGPDYVRTVDPLGREIGYWTHEEWREDPTSVMGQILDSLVRDRSFQRPPGVAAVSRSEESPAVQGSLDLIDIVYEAVQQRAKDFNEGGEVRATELVAWFRRWRVSASTALQFWNLCRRDAGVPKFAVGDLVRTKLRFSGSIGEPWRIKAVHPPRYHLDHPHDLMRDEGEGSLELVERADGSPVRVQRVEEIRLERPIRLYAEVFGRDEFGESPRWARISLDRRLLRDILRFRALVRTQGVLSVSIWDDPDKWSTQKKYPDPAVPVVVKSCLNVAAERFWYSADITPATYGIQTQAIAFDSLLPILGGGQTIEANFITRYEDVIVVSRGDVGDFVQRLLEDGEAIPGHVDSN